MTNKDFELKEKELTKQCEQKRVELAKEMDSLPDNEKFQNLAMGFTFGTLGLCLATMLTFFISHAIVPSLILGVLSLISGASAGLSEMHAIKLEKKYRKLNEKFENYFKEYCNEIDKLRAEQSVQTLAETEEKANSNAKVLKKQKLIKTESIKNTDDEELTK